MADVYSQIYVQYVFAVKGRENLLMKPWRDELFKYMSGIITAKNQKAIIVNGVADHVHVFVGIKPTMNMSDLVREIKSNSSNFINSQKYLKGKFAWQEGYGVFSYSHSQVKNVYNYILNQEEHHRQRSFKEEYLEFLEKFDIDFNEKYLFNWESE